MFYHGLEMLSGTAQL